MFGKKKCKKCGKDVGRKDSFCSSCGFALRNFEREEDWGMLGKNDSLFPEMNMPGFGTIFNSIMKDIGKPLFRELEEEMRKGIKKNPTSNKRGISISISTSGNNAPKIRINNLDGKPIKQYTRELPKAKKEKTNLILSEEKSRDFLTLPKEEPKTNVRRLSNKVIYEIELPGVKSLDDLSIMQLENSIEIKAVSKKKAYKKIIPIDFPIKGYRLSKEKLILELVVKQ